ncbi:MAG: HD-GYP domain-containing protein [Treponema sp.]|jgi:HD-GYP domain-containing protein (c-di-GMP phosphodiesterase class II)|nr:HD-GYP domain-containing protein [Treponema sp.]
MKKYAIQSIPPGSFFTKPVYADDAFIITGPEVTFSPQLIQILKNWEIKEVQSDGEPREDYAGDEETVQEAGGMDEKALLDGGEQIRDAEKFYNEFLRYTRDLFYQMAVGREIPFPQVAQRIKELCGIVKNHRRYLLRITRRDVSQEENYLAFHTVKSTIIAIIIGGYIKLPPPRLIELGVAALLHEIGMILLSPETYLNNRPLSPEERKRIAGHPILGYNLLKSLNYPLAVSLGALEHHERENGAGYPQRLRGDTISLYAKIIAVTCSYEALTSARPYKDAKDGYTGMLDLLKNEGRQYDETIVKALVYTLSIYPIGLYVLLSSGKKGQVVDVNPEFPKFPMVQVFGELSPNGKNKIIQTSPEGIYIARPLRKEEIG